MFKYYLGRVEFTISFFITDAVLAATLKDLFEDGIIDRKSYDEIPPPGEIIPDGERKIRRAHPAGHL